MPSRYDHIDFTPPQGARDAAESALRVRAEKPESERGMTAVGIARARDLIAGKTLSPKTVRRMLAYFQRHEVDKRGETWSERGKGWQAWNGWGGDAGYAWARKVVRQMDAADEKSSDMSDSHDVVDDGRVMRGEGLPIVCADGALAAAVGTKTWNQVARYGDFAGHPQGPFRFDAKTFAEIVTNFNATANRRVPVDYEHTSEVHPENVAQEGIPAKAWVVDLDDRGDAGLWGLFEWVDAKAVSYVRAGQYRYLSPAVVFGARSKETGKPIGARLTSVALTNHPFLDGMAPVTASEIAAAMRAELPSAVRTALAQILASDAGLRRDLTASARAAVTPADVHIPTTPGAKDNTKMEQDNAAAQPVAAKNPDAMSAEEMAELKGIKSKFAELEAAHAAECSAHAALKTSHGKLVSALSEMTGNDFEREEDAALEKLRAIVEQLRNVQKAEAEQMADRAIAAHGLSATRRDKLVAHALRDRADFLDAYPKVAETPAAKPAPVVSSETPAAKPAGTALSPDAKRLLSTHVTVDGGAPAESAVRMSDEMTVAERSKAREEYAARLMRDGKAKTHSEAALLADREMTAQQRKNAVAPFAG